MQSIFIFLLTLGCISIVSTYQCYSCHSSDKGDCGDPFNPNGMTDNDKEEAPSGAVCLKTKLESKGGSTVDRIANPLFALCIGGQNGCKEKSENGVTATVCCCTSNLCNGVSTVQQKPLIVFLTMSTLAMFAYQWY